MSLRFDLFCEDAAHERCAGALIRRCATELDTQVDLRVAAARFGIPNLKAELKAYQATVRKRGGTPDALVVVIDANTVGAAARRDEIEGVVDTQLFPTVVIATPDPCVERWLLADPASFAARFGVEPATSDERDGVVWKRRLTEALAAAGEIVIHGGAEFAEDIVDAMDLYQAARRLPSLARFLADVRGAVKLLA